MISEPCKIHQQKWNPLVQDGRVMMSENHPSDNPPFLRAGNTLEGESSCGSHLHGLGSHGSSASSPALAALLRVMGTLPRLFASVFGFALPIGGFDTEERKRNFWLSFLFRKGNLEILHSALSSHCSVPLWLSQNWPILLVLALTSH